MRLSAADVAAMMVSIILTVGVVLLSVLEIDIPAEMSGPLGAATTWLFVRSVQQGANGHA